MKSFRIDRIGLMQSVCRDINDHPRTLVGGSSETLERVETVGEVTWRQIIAEGEKEVENGYQPDNCIARKGECNIRLKCQVECNIRLKCQVEPREPIPSTEPPLEDDK